MYPHAFTDLTVKPATFFLELSQLLKLVGIRFFSVLPHLTRMIFHLIKVYRQHNKSIKVRQVNMGVNFKGRMSP